MLCVFSAFVCVPVRLAQVGVVLDYLSATSICLYISKRINFKFTGTNCVVFTLLREQPTLVFCYAFFAMVQPAYACCASCIFILFWKEHVHSWKIEVEKHCCELATTELVFSLCRHTCWSCCVITGVESSRQKIRRLIMQVSENCDARKHRESFGRRGKSGITSQ